MGDGDGRARSVLAMVATTGLLTALLAIPAGGASAGTGPVPAGTGVPATTPVASASADRQVRAKAPVYRDPPSYRGLKKSPQTKDPGPRRTTIGAGGENPDVYVDEAGTAHIVWNEPRGSAADVAVYCRLPRGAASCAARAELTWVKPYGYGDSENLNVDSTGPRIVRVGEQLVVLSYRFPTVTENPAGYSSKTVLAWTSFDGGTSWGAPGIIGANRFDDVAVVGSAERPRILTYGQDPLCAARPGEAAGQGCLVSYEAGAFRGQGGVLLGGTADASYYADLDVSGGQVLAAMSNTAGSTWVRRWNGAEPLDAGASWSVSAPMAGAEPVLATGRGGSFLMTRGGDEDPLLGEIRVRRLKVGGDGVVSAGKPVIVSDGGRLGELVQDPSGGLHGVWIEDKGVTYRHAAPGSLSFSGRQVLVRGYDNGQWRLSAAADGGGTAVLRHGDGAIVASSFGNPAPTGVPGVSGIPGGGSVGCTEVKFGAFDIVASSGCFLEGSGNAKGVVVSEGAVELNGLEIVPEPGSRLAFDPKALTIDTVSSIPGSKAAGTARVLMRRGETEVELFKGRLSQNLAGLKPGSTLFEFPPDLDRTNVFGFKVESNLPVKLTKDGVEVPLEVKLPKAFGGITGKATLIADRDGGLRLKSLNVSIRNVPLGALLIKSIDIDWAQGGTWRGKGELVVPATGTLKVDVEFVGGSFRSARAAYSPTPPIALGPKVYLMEVGGGLSLEPTTIEAYATVGAPIPVQPPVLGTGRFTMKFPHGQAGSFELKAQITVYSMEIAQGYVRFDTDGYAAFGGSGRIALGPVNGSIAVDGFIDGTKDQFGATVKVGGSYCTTDKTVSPPKETCETQGLEMVWSSLGFAICTGLANYSARWEGFNPADLSNFSLTCKADEYRIAPPRPRLAVHGRASRQAASFAVASGLPSVTLAVPGTGGSPDVVVRGPNGDVLAQPGSAARGVEMVSVAGIDATYVGIRKPKGGTYTVEPVVGSVPIGQVLVSDGVKAAKVKGKVTKQKRGAVVRYRVARLGKQKVVLRETSRAGTRILGNLRSGSHRVRIKARGPAGKRTVEAVVMLNGIPVDVHRLGRYRASGPKKPGRVGKVRARLKGSSVSVKFRAPKSANVTVVQIKGSSGSRVTRAISTRSGRITLKGYQWDRRVVVRLHTVDEQGRKGPTVRRVLRRPGRPGRR